MQNGTGHEPPEGFYEQFDIARPRVSGIQMPPANDLDWDTLVRPVPAAWLTTAPPKRAWLLRDARRPRCDGALPLGKVGQVIAEGGAGKTMALIQLALAVATGTKWLGTFEVATPGRVLLILGEEDDEEIHRRIYRAARGVVGYQEDSIVAMGLSGKPCALLEYDERRAAVRSGFSHWLAAFIEKNGPWSLIVADPLSRFGGVDVETDNAMGTRFIQELEGFAMTTGATVLVSHHTNKISREGAEVTSASARGSSSVSDGARWQVSLKSKDVSKGMDDPDVRERLGETITLTFTKGNYNRKADPVMLRRAEGGPLVPLDAVDRQLVDQARSDTRSHENGVADRAKAREDAQHARRDQEDEALRAILAAQPGIGVMDLRASMAARLGKCGKDAVEDAIARAVQAGSVRVDGGAGRVGKRVSLIPPSERHQ